MNSTRLFINLKPGNTFIDRLNGKTKVRTFLVLILILIATWDIRLILPLFVLFVAGLISIKPNKNAVKYITLFVLFVNLFNLFLIWLVEPDFGMTIVGKSTELVRFNGFYVITSETLWYFLVRLSKFMATFTLSLLFIMSITPSELAAGLYSIHIPYKACMIVSLAFRYIPDISRDFQNIKISMQARGLELDSKKTKLHTRLKQYVLILAPLIVTSFDRVGNIANAMDLRGFGKKKTKTYYCEHEDTKNEKIMKVVYTLLLLLLIAIVVLHIVHPAKFQVWCPWVK